MKFCYFFIFIVESIPRNPFLPAKCTAFGAPASCVRTSVTWRRNKKHHTDFCREGKEQINRTITKTVPRKFSIRVKIWIINKVKSQVSHQFCAPGAVRIKRRFVGLLVNEWTSSCAEVSAK